MRRLRVKDIRALRRALERPRDEYRHFVPGRVVDARVMMYEHPDGALVSGRHGRFWVYVRVRYKLPRSRRVFEYDIAVHKLRGMPVFRELVENGAVEVTEG